MLKASGSLFNVLTDGLVPVNIGMVALSTVVMIYVASGGLRSVAFVDCAQAILLALGITILGFVVINYSGGWGGFTDGIASLVKQDISTGTNLTPDGHSMRVAIPGGIQMVSSGSKATGGLDRNNVHDIHVCPYGNSVSPAFSMWAFSNKTSKAFAGNRL